MLSPYSRQPCIRPLPLIFLFWTSETVHPFGTEWNFVSYVTPYQHVFLRHPLSLISSIITLAASSGKHNVMVWHRSVYLSCQHSSMTHQYATWPAYISAHYDPFCCIHRSREYLSMGQTTHKNCLFHWGNLNPHLTWFLWPTESASQTAHLLVQPFLQGSCMWPTDTWTDHVTPFLAIGRN